MTGYNNEKEKEDGSDNDDKNEQLELIPLQPVVKDYAWGIRGMDSRVARYALENHAVDDVDPDTPYAELWIGTHPKGPARLATTGETLRGAIGDDLPFLFKILSAGKASSIQAHPDHELAQQLHRDNPNEYGDPKHKPELAIALTPFEAMCGFRRLEEVSLLLKKHPEFANCISTEAKLAIFLASEQDSQKNALQTLFTSFMSCPAETSERNLKLLLVRLQAEQSYLHPHPHDEPAWERKCARAVIRLAQQFPNDPGVMAPFFLNYLLIAPGESFFMAANEPHAYVAGEIIVCMANSDNVVRAGLTNGHKDVENFVKMLTYSVGGPTIDVGSPVDGDSRILRYTPPVPEFEVYMINIDPGEQLPLQNPNVPSVIMILEGRGNILLGHQLVHDNNDDNNNNNINDVRPGQCYYWPPVSNHDNDNNSTEKRLLFSVSESRRGPLKLAMVHKNCHIRNPTAVNRDDFGLSSHASTVPASPIPSYLGARLSSTTAPKVRIGEGTPPSNMGDDVSFAEDTAVFLGAPSIPTVPITVDTNNNNNNMDKPKMDAKTVTVLADFLPDL